MDAVFDEEYGEYTEGGEQAAGAGDAETPAPPATTFAARFRKLNRAIVEVVNEFSMVGYRALNIMVRVRPRLVALPCHHPRGVER
mgnify:CR=1 FL=1